MALMKSKTVHYLIISLILMVAHLSSVTAVTDAELEALEKQIEQLESKEKKQLEAAEKKKAVAAAKRKEEIKRKAEAEAKRKAEELRLTELERQRQEKEAKERADEEKKQKYDALIAYAQQAFANKDKTQAIARYNEALALLPDDVTALSGIQQAQKLMDPFCYQLIGTWKEHTSKDITKFYENGIVSFKSTIVAYEHTWECHPDRREISMNYLNNDNPEYITSFKLLDDNKKLLFVEYGILYAEKISDGHAN
jgi:hypothetical protein